MRQREELATYYASADLFLFPSLTETFGNVVPEALASGLAVLSYANAAALELIIHNQNGVLVPSGDELGFVNAAVELALDPQRQQRLRERAPGSVAYLAWNAVSDAFEQVLRDVLQRHGQSFCNAPQGAAPLAGAALPSQERLPHAQLRSLG